MGEDGKHEWLLVEAKAHIDELESSCGAKPHGGRPKIETFLDRAKQHLGVQPNCDWLNGHYQYANRLATLSFLDKFGVSARLVFIYFTGDHHLGWSCPPDASGWQQDLIGMKSLLGLPAIHPLSGRIHDLFLRVA